MKSRTISLEPPPVANETIFRDTKAENFRQVVEQKIKEFHTLEQLDQTLQKQTPRISSRPERIRQEQTEHPLIKRLAQQVKQKGRSCSD